MDTPLKLEDALRAEPPLYANHVRHMAQNGVVTLQFFHVYPDKPHTLTTVGPAVSLPAVIWESLVAGVQLKQAQASGQVS